VRVETDPYGTGTVVPAQSLAPGYTVQGYAISRDVNGNFLGNIAVTWSLQNRTSAVVDGDLVPTGDGKSATFTANLSGTANIRAISGTLASVDSGLLTVSRALTWVGGGANPWDFATSNWTPDYGSTRSKFLDSDDVTFDYTGAMTPAVNITSTVKPHSVNVTAGPYTIGGASGISGVAALTNSSGTLLTLLNSNDYTGFTVVSLGSTLQLGNGVNNGSLGKGPVSIETGGTSPIFNRTDAVSAPYVVSNIISGPADFLMEFKTGAVKFAGTGDNTHARAVVRNGATLLLVKTTGKDLGNLVSAYSGPVLDIETGGKVVCGGPGTSADHIDAGGNTAQGLRYVTINGTFDLNSTETLGGITDGSSGTINNTSTNAAILTVGNGINDSSTATFAGTIQNTGTGTLGVTKDGTNTWILNSANTYRGDTRITGGGVLQLGNVNSMQNSTLDNQAGDTGSLSFGSLTSATLGGLKNAKGLGLTNAAGTAVALTMGGNGQANTYSGVLSDGGSLTKTGAGTQTMSGTNIHSGATTVSQGTLLVNGGWTASAITVGASGTLGGIGTIGTTVGVTGTLRPCNNAIGKLTVNSTATLSGSTVMEINRSLNAPTNCDVLAATTLNLGGSLTVTNLGSMLKTGDTFTLFSASLSGAITPATLPALWPGLTWDTSLLNSAGKLSVAGAQIPPVISSVGTVGTNLTLNGTGGLAGVTYYLVSSTNVAAAMATWQRVSTNVFAANGSFTNTIPISQALPRNFFRVQVP
jgi:autotransporter-associated beta strand protein